MIRAVLEANVVVSARISSNGAPGRILTRFLKDRAFELVLSKAILQEIRRSLDYPRVRRRIQASDEDLDAWVAALGLLRDLVEPARIDPLVQADSGDDKYLACALEGRASHLVSGDRHLLDQKAHQDVAIVSTASFLVLLDRA